MSRFARIESLEKKDKRVAWIVSALFILLLLVLFFILTAYRIQDPIPSEGTVSISMADYGYTDSGSGDVETPPSSAPVEEVVQETVAQETADIVDQAESEVAVSDAAEPTDTQEIVDNPGESSESTDTPVEEPVEEPEPTISDGLSDAFSDAFNNDPGTDGTEGEGQNEGVETGKIDGKGELTGDGVSEIYMGGRGRIGEPSIVSPKKEGKVVLEIYVDSQGKIISSKPDYEKSNTTSAELFALAKEAIKTLSFVPEPGKPKQKGYITFNFKLK